MTRRTLLLIGVAGLVSAVAVGFGVARSGGDEPPDPIEARGVTLQTKVDSVIEQARARYPFLDVEVRGLGNEGLLLRVGWVKPDADDPDYVAEVGRRAEDQREATLAIFQAVARSHRPMKHFGAFEDRMLVPIWSRAQILDAGSPEVMRDYAIYTEFQFDAELKEGYATISGRF